MRKKTKGYLKTLTVDITENMIDSGIINAYDCPLAQAIAPHVNSGYEVGVGQTNIWVRDYGTQANVWEQRHSTETVRNFVLRFDQWKNWFDNKTTSPKRKKPKPQRMVVRLPREYLKDGS